MKPRARRQFGFWQCVGEVGHFTVIGVGETLAEAYRSYHSKMLELITSNPIK